jgi:hypothetical protein
MELVAWAHRNGARGIAREATANHSSGGGKVIIVTKILRKEFLKEV